MNDPLIDAGLLSPVRAGTPVESECSDVAWLQAMLDAEAALVRAQSRLGTVPADAATAITEAARAENFDVRALALLAREAANPVVGLVQAMVAVVAGRNPAAADFVHRGSTSQDILDTAAMLVAQRCLRAMQGDLRRVAGALADLAAEHRDTLLIGRTLAMHAVPITFGLKAAGWRKLVLDADERLSRLLVDGLPVSLGGAAGTLAGYLEYARLDRADGSEIPDDYAAELTAAFAAETGLARAVLPWHSLRTPIADLASVLAFTAGALGKIAVDVQSMARTEVAELAEPGGTGRGSSSAMPHKRNPVLSTLVRSSALQVTVLGSALSQCLISEDERSAGIWHAEWQLLRECLRLTGGATSTMVELAEGLVVRTQRMADNVGLTDSQVTSERVAAALSAVLGKAAAKGLVSEATSSATRRKVALHQVLVESPELDGVLSPARLRELCDPAGYLGAAGNLVDRALAEHNHRH